MSGMPGQAQNLPEVGLHGAGVHPLSKLECVDYVIDQLEQGQGGWLLAADLGFLLNTFRELFQEWNKRLESQE